MRPDGPDKEVVAIRQVVVDIDRRGGSISHLLAVDIETDRGAVKSAGDVVPLPVPDSRARSWRDPRIERSVVDIEE